ncbi:site-2 protease family protein [Agriterribacter sp.]|uniref:site-2 protease family protein n=1 Tax=Agriterribacter sp. TaxID=2821509 RepID=UPI002BBFC2C5|nr:site-2 protease family protein [Agriterribacter sp.]HRO45521.1 site-2 protease family protein [Agriterribacter sp.]HRQ17957.1 site-2 protease family protein [Agriterribacter sp.]
MANDQITDNRGRHHKKPVPAEMISTRRTWVKTIISFILYVGVYYYFFHDNIKWLIILTSVILLHEAGHFIAMKSFGYKDVQMFFVPFVGAFVSGEPRVVSRRQRIITLLAGPVPGMLIGLVFFLIFLQNQQPVYYQLSFVLVMLNAFNLLPVTPLDGGQLLENIFFRAGEKIQLAFLIVSALLLFYLALYTRNYLIVFIVWIIVIRYRSISTISRVRDTLDKESLSYHTTFGTLTDEAYMAIRKTMIKHIKALKQYDPEIVSTDEEAVVAHLNKILVPPVQNEITLKGKLLIAILWIMLMIIPFVVYSKYAPGYILE